MMFEEALTQRMLEAGPLRLSTGGNFYWGTAPEETQVPYITAQIAARNRDYTHDGADDLQYPRVQFDVYGSTRLEVLKISRLLLTELEAPQTVSSIAFEDALLVYESDADVDSSDAGTPTFRNTMDFLVPHRPVVEGA